MLIIIHTYGSSENLTQLFLKNCSHFTFCFQILFILQFWRDVSTTIHFLPSSRTNYTSENSNCTSLQSLEILFNLSKKRISIQQKIIETLNNIQQYTIFQILSFNVHLYLRIWCEINKNPSIHVVAFDTLLFN